ncbi:RluA family pseudouridine synthase [Vagococcus elongatus]|uniref:Pseudouridine synthase n=1 Tax=Vagococcus elongatus TaxID=180344 RepID=A0A430B5T7_9ENTE|nr:RluA family pseudouridine synthase [Vagococcus elongatus]RSU15665.1 pseudouridine synthase [Vagococcus elongatus]
MKQEITLTVSEEKGRIDKVLAAHLADTSRSQIQHWLKGDCVFVNGEPVSANYKVKKNDTIVVTPPENIELELSPEAIPLDIVYEDTDIIVVNKPQGMVVHPSKSHQTGTLVNALLYHTSDLSGINGVIRPGIVHRIDKDTSGLLVVAKNDQAHKNLQEQMMAKTVIRKYSALVHGEIPHETGTIDAPIDRSKSNRLMNTVREGGRKAVTHFKVLKRFTDYTLIECQLETGRTHQIRVHLKYIDFPIAGDPIYGPAKTLKGQGQYLHAGTLGFKHPVSGKNLLFEVPPPEVFQKTLKKLEK